MSRSKPSGLATRMGKVYTFHFVPRLAHAGHYTGWAENHRLPHRVTDHALGRGARITQAQREAGGSWIVADVQSGTRDRETTLKERGAARRCPVCRAEADFAQGKTTAAEALAAAGWDKATQHERNLLLADFGLEAAPEGLAVKEPEPEVIAIRHPKASAPEVTPEKRAEMEALADDLIAQWRAELDFKEAEEEREMEFG